MDSLGRFDFYESSDMYMLRARFCEDGSIGR